MSEAPMLTARIALCKLPFKNKAAFVNFAEKASEEDKLNHAKLIALREQISIAASYLKVGDMVWAERFYKLFKGRIIAIDPYTFHGGITSIKFTLEITEPGKVFSNRHVGTNTVEYASEVEAVTNTYTGLTDEDRAFLKDATDEANRKAAEVVSGAATDPTSANL